MRSTLRRQGLPSPYSGLLPLPWSILSLSPAISISLKSPILGDSRPPPWNLTGARFRLVKSIAGRNETLVRARTAFSVRRSITTSLSICITDFRPTSILMSLHTLHMLPLLLFPDPQPVKRNLPTETRVLMIRQARLDLALAFTPHPAGVVLVLGIDTPCSINYVLLSLPYQRVRRQGSEGVRDS